MPQISEFVSEKIAKLKVKNIYRQIHAVERTDFPYVLKAGKKLVSFACNDYLGLSQHPEVKEAAIDAIQKYGAGAGASRLVSGSSPLYDELEELLAKHHNQEAACVFGSGYLANIGVINALANEKTLIVADKLAHACMIDGAVLSGGKLIRYNHNNLNHLLEILEKHRDDFENCIVMTETVFSMDGDLAPLTEIRAIADKFDCWLLTDVAHNLHNNQSQAHITIGTLSKAFGGYGGYVAAKSEVIEYIKSTARSLIFSTALPPATIAAAIAAAKIIAKEESLAISALKNAELFCDLLDLPKPQSQIVPLVVGDAEKAIEIARKLAEYGFLVPAIRPPTVPPGSSRLRFSFSSAHKNTDIEKLAEHIRQIGI